MVVNVQYDLFICQEALWGCTQTRTSRVIIQPVLIVITILLLLIEAQTAATMVAPTGSSSSSTTTRSPTVTGSFNEFKRAH